MGIVQLHLDFRAGGLDPGVQRVGIADGDIDGIGAAAAEIADHLAVLVVTALAEHQQ